MKTMTLVRFVACVAAAVGLCAATARASTPYDDLADSLLEELQNARQQDPLRYLASDMGEIKTDLSEYKTDQPVQAKQEKVVKRLDKLIEELEKACKSGAGGGGANPTRPANSSQILKGPGGSGAMHDPREGDKDWGQLPPKQREQILQSRTEGFPAGYESMLQRYYQRLAQEQVSDETAAGDEAAGPGAPGEDEDFDAEVEVLEDAALEVDETADAATADASADAGG